MVTYLVVVSTRPGKKEQIMKLLAGKFCDFDWKNKEIPKGNMPYWWELWSN